MELFLDQILMRNRILGLTTEVDSGKILFLGFRVLGARFYIQRKVFRGRFLKNWCPNGWNRLWNFCFWAQNQQMFSFFQNRKIWVIRLQKAGMNFTGRQHSGIDDARNIARILGWSKKNHKCEICFIVLYIDESPGRARFGVEFQCYNYIDCGIGQFSFHSDNRLSILVSKTIRDRMSISIFAYPSWISSRELKIWMKRPRISD